MYIFKRVLWEHYYYIPLYRRWSSEKFNHILQCHTVNAKMSFKVMWERILESMSRSGIFAAVYKELLGNLERMHDWFTKHKRKLPQSIHWLIRVCTHSHIYSNIPSFSKCSLMKTMTNAGGCISQLKVVTWIHSWLFLTVSSLWSSEVMKTLLP